MLYFSFPNVGKSSFMNKVGTHLITVIMCSHVCVISKNICIQYNVLIITYFVQVTRADVEVQPYAFTTKSLFVGHMDYKYLRWQVGCFSSLTLLWCMAQWVLISLIYHYDINSPFPKFPLIPDKAGVDESKCIH